MGVLIEQTVVDSYVWKRNCATSRKFLILKWILISFLLSSGFRSVLLSTLVSPSYEKPIDTVQDLLDTERPVHAEGSILPSLRYSALDSIRKLVQKIKNTANETEINLRLYEILLMIWVKNNLSHHTLQRQSRGGHRNKTL